MQYHSLIVNLTNSSLLEELDDIVKNKSANITYSIVNYEEALTDLDLNNVIFMAIVADKHSSQVDQLLIHFQSKVGCIPSIQGIVCSNPEPEFLANTFEFGVEQYISKDEMQKNIIGNTQKTIESLEDIHSFLHKIYSIFQTIRNGNQKKITLISQTVLELCPYDYLAAYTTARSYEAVSEYEQAENFYKQSYDLNPYFRPAALALGEVYLILNQLDEAVGIYQELEKTNKQNLTIKVSLASCFLEKNELDEALKYIKEASTINAKSPKVIEAKVQYFLKKGEIDKALKLLEQLDHIGPFFAAKLNETGVNLAQEGKTQDAISLYQKAHKIVRGDLKYKISLNAALAARKNREFDTALKYVHRCKREYGGSFPKLEKIEENIRLLKQQQRKS